MGFRMWAARWVADGPSSFSCLAPGLVLLKHSRREYIHGGVIFCPGSTGTPSPQVRQEGRWLGSHLRVGEYCFPGRVARRSPEDAGHRCRA